ncbi:hypothetical protein C5167_021805 [Papaver somniferum]|uniref:Uncharacterized protein n=1 Tax=Papaver somniferum TaxID=3469 RepID=A0A4Y7JFX5_PAPSO|nr:hypothetical protein C5167_021805 [Papaver somniferum]
MYPATKSVHNYNSGTAWNRGLWTQTEQHCEQQTAISAETKIYMPSSGISSSEITTQENADQVGVDIFQEYVASSNIAPDLSNQLLIEGQVTNSSSSLLAGAVAQETAVGDDNNNSAGVTSQVAEQTTIALANFASQVSIPDLKTAMKVAILVIPISAGGIISVVAGVMEMKIHTHGVLFKAYVTLCCISFFTGVVLLFLSLIPKRLPGLVIKVTMWVSLGSITYAIGCGCIMLLKSLVVTIFILVTPPAVAFVLLVLYYAPCEISPRSC